MIHVLLAGIGALLPLTNPLGAIAAFAGLTGTMEPARRKAQAVRTAIYVFAILAVFALVGGFVLEAFGISLPALQIAGGIVVAHSGFGMMTPRPKATEAEQQDAATKSDVSFSPMALPLVAGPGAIGVVIALGARFPGIENRLVLVASAAVIALVIGVILRFGTPIADKMGAAAIGALTRVMGFLILAIGVELVVHGVKAAGF